MVNSAFFVLCSFPLLNVVNPHLNMLKLLSSNPRESFSVCHFKDELSGVLRFFLACCFLPFKVSVSCCVTTFFTKEIHHVFILNICLYG